MNTLLLDSKTWDLVVDASGNIAMASEPYAIAQDVASAIRMFQGEYYYDTTQGVPYWTQLLGQAPSIPLLKAKLVAAALTVPGVVKARCFLSSITNRSVSGQVQFIDTTGVTQGVSF